MGKVRTSNKEARYYVNSLTEFQGANTFGEYVGEHFVVYSYGKHFPMYANINGVWYGNSSKYSVSTSKQQTQLKPSCEVREYMTTEELKKKIRNGKAEEGSSTFKLAGMVARMGEMMTDTPEDETKWKKRMLGTIDGISFPDDFDGLPEDEKKRRLDEAIKVSQEK